VLDAAAKGKAVCQSTGSPLLAMSTNSWSGLRDRILLLQIRPKQDVRFVDLQQTHAMTILGR
jgi:hypothetical protein